MSSGVSVTSITRSRPPKRGSNTGVADSSCRSSVRSVSPSSAVRQSITSVHSKKKARKVRFFRNGDAFYKGATVAVLSERYPTLDSLLSELNKGPVCDPVVLPKGIRYIFSLDGQLVKSVDELKDGDCYVCASANKFRKIDYRTITGTGWNNKCKSPDVPLSVNSSLSCTADQDSFIQTRFVYVIRSGPRPRKLARVLLSKKTARSLDQVLTMFATNVSVDSGTIKTLYGLSGHVVSELKDLFLEDTVFVAYRGMEKFSPEDLVLDNAETKIIRSSGFRHSAKQGSRSLPRLPSKGTKANSATDVITIEADLIGSEKSLEKLSGNQLNADCDEDTLRSDADEPAIDDVQPAAAEVEPATEEEKLAVQEVTGSDDSKPTSQVTKSAFPESERLAEDVVESGNNSNESPSVTDSPVVPAGANLAVPVTDEKAVPSQPTTKAAAGVARQSLPRGAKLMSPRSAAVTSSCPSSLASKLPRDVNTSSAKVSEDVPRVVSPRHSPRSPRASSCRSPRIGILTSNATPSTRSEQSSKFGPVLLEKYELGEHLMETDVTSIFQCTRRGISPRSSLALKVINKQLISDGCRESMLYRELSLLRRLKHSNILELIDDIDTTNYLCLVLPLIKQGKDLYETLVDFEPCYTERDACDLLVQLCSALKYLHSVNVVHRNVKPDSCLVYGGSNGWKCLKLSDFGLATEVGNAPLYDVCGTPAFMAPEIIAQTGYGRKVDVWSAGVVGCILLTGSPLVTISDSVEPKAVFEKILGNQYRLSGPAWDLIGDQAKDLICWMLEERVEARGATAEVLEHPWLSEDVALHCDILPSLVENVKSLIKPRIVDSYVSLIATTALDKASCYYVYSPATSSSEPVAKPSTGKSSKSSSPKQPSSPRQLPASPQPTSPRQLPASPRHAPASPRPATSPKRSPRVSTSPPGSASTTPRGKSSNSLQAGKCAEGKVAGCGCGVPKSPKSGLTDPTGSVKEGGDQRVTASTCQSASASSSLEYESLSGSSHAMPAGESQ